MNKKSRPYEVGLHERLKDRMHAVNYINAAAADSIEGFLMALRDLAEATKGMSGLANASSRNRENLYRMLSGEGNPRLDSLWSVLDALELRITVESINGSEQATAGLKLRGRGSIRSGRPIGNRPQADNPLRNRSGQRGAG
jgi:probable addiction module antidote protein